MASRTPKSFKFQSVRQSSVVDQIIETFKQALISGELHPGQRLPSEAELMRQFGVGRSAIREAMKILQALGIVTIQQGNGTYIVDEPQADMFDPLVFAIMLETKMSDDLFELRRLIEIGYCELAAQHATDEDLNKVEQAAQALERAAAQPEHEVETLTRLDLDFHRAVLEASHNPLVIRIGLVVEELFFASIRNTYLADENNPDYAVSAHRRIIDALKASDPKAIRAAIEYSLVNWRKEVQKLGEYSDPPDRTTKP